jgi:outer membrane protein OmpA-like peptidoglycan-associated protein
MFRSVAWLIAVWLGGCGPAVEGVEPVEPAANPESPPEGPSASPPETVEDGCEIRLPSVRFLADSAEPAEGGETAIDRLAELLGREGSHLDGVELAGHADDAETDPDGLAFRRAAAVAAALAARGIAPERLAPVGYGAACPLDEGEDEARRAVNRRVDPCIRVEGTCSTYAACPAVRTIAEGERPSVPLLPPSPPPPPPPPPGGVVPRAAEPEPTTEGAHDGPVIQAIVWRSPARAAVRRCYEMELLGAPDLAGTVTIRMEIGPDGAVGAVAASANTTGSEALARCVEEAVRAMRFPRSDGVTSVTYPFRFETAGGSE